MEGGCGLGKIAQRQKMELKALRAQSKVEISKTKQKSKKQALQILYSEKEKVLLAQHAAELEGLEEDNNNNNNNNNKGRNGDGDGDDDDNEGHPKMTGDQEIRTAGDGGKQNDDVAHDDNQGDVMVVPQFYSEQPLKTPTRWKRRRERELAKLEKMREELNSAEDSGQLEMKTIVNELSASGLALHAVPSDGHCLFRAMEHQLNWNGPQTGSQTWNYKQLRALASEHMFANRDEYAPYLHEDDHEQVPKDGDNDDDPDVFQRYCASIKETPAWGGELEIRALSDCLQRAIEVHCAGDCGTPSVVHGAKYISESASPLRIAFHKKLYALGPHYNSIVNAPSDDAT